MNLKDREYIKELEFTYSNKPFRYQYGDIMYKNDLGRWAKLCELDITHTAYANDENVLILCCHCAIKGFWEGVGEGMQEKTRQIKKILNIK